MTTPVKTILASLLTTTQDWQLQLLNAWPSLFGQFKTKIQLLKIYDDTLVLGVADSCWMQELYLLTPALLTTINQKLDQPRIKHLRFKSVGIPKEAKEEERVQKKALKIIQLSKREREILAGIKDPQLASYLEAYLCRIYQER